MIGFNEVKGCTVINPLQLCFYTWLLYTLYLVIHLNIINCSFWFIKVVRYSLFDFFYFLVVHYLIMGNSIDCFYATRQWVFLPVHSVVFVHRSASLIDILKPEKGVIWKFPKSLADINTDKEIASALALGKVSLHINLKWYDNITILMLRIAFHKPVESS